MAERPCTTCSSAERTRLVSKMIAAGSTNQAIADRIGGINRMSVSRHRHNRILAPAKAIAEAAQEGQEAAAQEPRRLPLRLRRPYGVRQGACYR